jgi:hypothetical protein
VRPEEELLQEYGVTPPDGSPPPLGLGGWGEIPQGLCDRCLQPIPDPPDLGAPTFSCLLPPGSTCDDGQVMFHDDFEADTVGSAPGPSPAGPPPGDGLVSSGSVTVVSSGSNAARLVRSSAGVADLTAVLDAGAAGTGAYCVRFTGTFAGFEGAPVVVTFSSVGGALAWRLIIDESSAHIHSGAPSGFLEVADFSERHSFRFDVDLDLKTFDAFLDGRPMVAGAPFLQASFDVPAELGFQIGLCILECFESSWTVDDIKVTKTS